MTEVFRLENQGKSVAAAEMLASLPQGTQVGAKTIGNASHALEQLLYRLGGLNTVGRVLDSFFARPAVRTAMTDHVKARTVSHEEATVDAIIKTAKSFFTGIMAASGRRSDTNTNAFFAAASALVPVTAREDRMVRSVMRVLGLSQESVKRAIEIRKAMVDTAAGWSLIETQPHADRVDWSPLKRWLHSDDASTPDNDNKTEIMVHVSDDGTTVSYELHDRRYWNDKQEVLKARFRSTPTFAILQQTHLEKEMRKRRAQASRAAKAKLERGQEPTPEQVEEEVAGVVARVKERAARRIARRRLKKTGIIRDPTAGEVDAEREGAPEISEFVVGKRQWKEALCNCTFNRKGGECDCPLCTYITHNYTRFRRDMTKWHSSPNHFCREGCMDVGSGFREALVDVHQLTKFVLCGKIEVPELTRQGAKRPFWTYGQGCLHSTCSAPVLGRRCGWDDKVPPCPMLVSKERYAWKRYENQQSGVNRETGEPFYRTEFVLHIGTAVEFIGEFKEQYASWLPHYHLDRLIKNNKRLLNDKVQLTELVEATTLQSVSDYASQPSLPREFTPTCQSKKKMNNCVMLLSFKPYLVNRYVEKRGRRDARTVKGTRNECIVVYGLFDSDIKPSAQQYNMQRLDAEMYLKFGFTVHGEFFVNRMRIPRYQLRAPTAEDDTEDEPEGAQERKCATMGKRVLIYFSSLNDHYAGIVDGYDSEKDGGCYYRVVFDDGDEEDYPWRDVQLGIFWNVTGGFVPAEHEEPLPTGSIASAGGVEWALADEKELKPRLPLLKNHYESTDGAGLFQGETNYGQIGRGATGPSKVVRHGIIDVANHGKNVSDPAGGQFQARLNESVASNHEVYPGTRNIVLYMAQHHPSPATGAGERNKPTTWSPDTKVYAYYSRDLLSSRKNQHFKPYLNSKKYHSRRGLCTSASRADTFGPLCVNEAFCACLKCLELKFEECLVKKHVGQVRTVEVPRQKGEKAVVTQALALPAFVTGVKKNETWAVIAAEDERATEGRYWLARILEDPYQNPEAFLHCGERFEKGYYIAKIHWLRCVRRGVVRSYKEERTLSYLSMNAAIRTDGPVKLAKPRRGTRKGELDLSSEEQTRIFNAT